MRTVKFDVSLKHDFIISLFLNIQFYTGCPTRNYTLFNLLGKTRYNFLWDTLYKFDNLLPQNIDRFSGSTPRVLIVTLPDKSPGVIPLDSRTRLDEIYNSQKAFNDIKEVLRAEIITGVTGARWILWTKLTLTLRCLVTIQRTVIMLDEDNSEAQKVINEGLHENCHVRGIWLLNCGCSVSSCITGMMSEAVANNDKHSGSTSSCDYSLSRSYTYISTVCVQKSSRITSGYWSVSTKISTLGVLPENLYLFFGSNISNLYILSKLLPM